MGVSTSGGITKLGKCRTLDELSNELTALSVQIRKSGSVSSEQINAHETARLGDTPLHIQRGEVGELATRSVVQIHFKLDRLVVARQELGREIPEHFTGDFVIGKWQHGDSCDIIM